MKILLVNGYSNDLKSLQAFSSFQYTVQKIFSSQTEYIDTETEFFVRDLENLDDFLFEIDSSFIKKEAGKSFDLLDMIFIVGKPNLLPWSPRAQKILILIRMCFRVKKCLFACSFAMHALVFFCASSIQKNINVVNGKGKGSKISDGFKEAGVSLTDLKANDYFLDNVTGDLYSYSLEKADWTAKTNTGLHYERSAYEYQTIGKYVLQAPMHRFKTANGSNSPVLSNPSEKSCFLKKNYLNHWLFIGCEPEFLVLVKCQWYIHSFSFTNPKKAFSVLAECERGPLMIELDNIIGVLFEIEKKYQVAINILSNYIMHMLKKIKSRGSNSSASVVDYSTYKMTGEIGININHTKPAKERTLNFEMNTYTTREQGSQSSGTSRMISGISSDNGELARHAGYAFKKTENQAIVKNNRIARASHIQINTHRIQQKANDKIPLFDIDRIDKITNVEALQLLHTTLGNLNGYRVLLERTRNPKISEIRSRSQEIFGLEKSSSNGVLNLENKVLETEEKNFLSRNKIREILHPAVSVNKSDEDGIWTPGDFSHAKLRRKPALRIHSMDGNSLRSLASSVGGKTMSDWSNNNSISNGTPYVTPEEIDKIRERENQKKIIGPAHFKTKVDSSEIIRNYIQNYVRVSPGDEIFKHRFRDLDKSKWMTSNSFRFPKKD